MFDYNCSKTFKLGWNYQQGKNSPKKQCLVVKVASDNHEQYMAGSAICHEICKEVKWTLFVIAAHDLDFELFDVTVTGGQPCKMKTTFSRHGKEPRADLT